jgi:hypothetical protein
MEIKQIKLHKDTYDRLDRIRVKGESFDNVTGRLLKMYEQLEDMARILGPHHWLTGPNPPSATRPLPTYCPICKRPVTDHHPRCPNAAVKEVPFGETTEA